MPHGLRHVGLKAVNSLRLEKGYRDYGHDIDNLDNVYDVGLSFTCDLTKDFNGKAHVLEAAARPRARRPARILRPALVAIRARKPCLRFRLIFDG